MKRYAKEVVERTIMTSIVCDICEKEYSSDDIFEMQEFVHVYVDGGYGSVFGDGAQLALDLCQYCVQAKLGEYLKDMSSSTVGENV